MDSGGQPTSSGSGSGKGPSYLACGCGGIVMLVMVAFTGLTWWGYRQGKELERIGNDPQAREEKVREVLDYDDLPAGYYPLMSMSIPMVADFAMFSDQPPTPAGDPKAPKADRRKQHGFKERGFVFVRMRDWGNSSEETRRFIEGKGPEPDWMEDRTGLESGEVIGRGVVDVNGTKVPYLAQRGEMNARGAATKGLVTLMLADCPGRKHLRFGIWFGPDPHAGKPVAQADYTGTPADPKQIRDFAGHFRFCPAP